MVQARQPGCYKATSGHDGLLDSRVADVVKGVGEPLQSAGIAASALRAVGYGALSRD